MTLLPASSAAQSRFYAINTQISYVRHSSCYDEVQEALTALGIHYADATGMEIMRQKIIETLSPDAKILPSSNDPGVFFIYDLYGYSDEEKVVILNDIKAGLSSRKPSEHLEPISVFKIGAKRAQMELTVRKIATLLGFSKYALPGAFFCVSQPDFSSWIGEENCAQEDLWNGMIKDYLTSNETSAVVGILEPFSKTASYSKQKQKELYVMILVLSLAIGLRDAREDNVTDVILDSEECMPNRLDPDYTPSRSRRLSTIDLGKKEVAATHLPFLRTGCFEQTINQKDFLKIRDIVSSWNIDEICSELASEKIAYADLVCEYADLGTEYEKILVDDGGCKVKVSTEEEVFQDDGLYTPTFLAQTDHVFNTSQMQAFRERLKRLKKVITSPPTDKITPADIVRAVDPFYMQQIRIIQADQEKQKEVDLLQEDVRSLASGSSAQHKFSQSGRVSPFELAGRMPINPQILDFQSPGDIKAASMHLRNLRERTLSERSQSAASFDGFFRPYSSSSEEAPACAE